MVAVAVVVVGAVQVEEEEEDVEVGRAPKAHESAAARRHRGRHALSLVPSSAPGGHGRTQRRPMNASRMGQRLGGFCWIL